MEMRTFRDSNTMVQQGAFDGGTEGARRATGVAPSTGRPEEPTTGCPVSFSLTYSGRRMRKLQNKC